jgi:hypothetical protein
MSVVDCQGMGLSVIAPRLGWLAEHIDGELLFDTDAEAIALAERLAYDTEFSAVHAKRAHASTAHLTPAAVAARYLEAISLPASTRCCCPTTSRWPTRCTPA